jgi:hypothetical protein
MKVAKVVINLIIAFFIISGIYFKISDTTSKGWIPMGSRSGAAGFQQSVVTWYSLFFFAFVFIIFRLMMNLGEKETGEKK